MRPENAGTVPSMPESTIALVTGAGFGREAHEDEVRDTRVDGEAERLQRVGQPARQQEVERPAAGRAARLERVDRVIVRAIKTGKAPLVLLPPLVMHDRDGGKHTVEAEAILRGETNLPW